MNTTLPWMAHVNRDGLADRPRDRLRVAAAILDGVFVSLLLWLALLLIVH